MDNIHLTLTASSIENLEIFSEILEKDYNTMINEALSNYFEEQQQKLLEKNIENENALTNLDYDEFWDGIEI